MDGADAIKYILKNNIEGAVIECGVCYGLFEYIWIKELLEQKEVRDIYLYDTFKGCTEPTEFDYTCETATIYRLTKQETYNWWQNCKITDDTNGMCYCPLEKVKENLEGLGYDNSRLHYVEGDVLQTLKDKSTIPEKIAILRLDTDWYESSKYELEQMYDNVVDGGVIIFDDYLHWDGQRRATDEFFKQRGLTYEHVDIGNGKTTAIIKKSQHIL
jgi:hypothetical protein